MSQAGAPPGLSREDAARRLARDGPNQVEPPRPTPLAVRILRQFGDPLVLLLLAAFAVTLVVADYPDASVIALVVVVNTAIGVTQEVRADRAIAALTVLAAPTATVVREGADVQVPAAEVVRGDLVRLAAGDIIPADLRLSQAERLLVDESAVSGESVPVWRDRGDEVHAGTVVGSGRGVGEAVRTGAESGLGRIAALVAATRPGPTPLQRRLAALGRVLGGAVVALSGVVFLIGVLAGRPPLLMAITGVSLVVAAVPESLPAVVTLSLALAARRMAENRAIPRRLHAAETLGSVTVVASDKTGTLTEGRMAVQRAVDAGGREYDVAGYGYEPTGTISGADATEALPAALLELARAGLLCNDATIKAPTPELPDWAAVGDPLEAALVVFAARCGLDPDAERATWPRVGERPFDQRARRMTTVHKAPDGAALTICKGAPEAVLAAPIVADPPSWAVAAAHRLADAGLRVLAVAASTSTVGEPDRPMRALGLIAIGDPVRSSARRVAESFAEAGIRLVLITGDHPGTAAAVGGHLGIWREGDEVHHGDRGAPDRKRSEGVRVFARTQPEQKLDIIASLQSNGHVVAMTGDGVNDAPALRRADIGVAMGGGTEVARQAADLVLVDDNLATLTGAVREGRRIYANIRRFLLYGLAGGTAEILVMLVGPSLGFSLPLRPAQILWVNLLTHGVPGVALGAEPGEAGAMRRPPRPPDESVLGAGLLARVLAVGSLLAAVTLGAGVLAYHWDRPWQSIIFVVLGLAQLGVALAVRAHREPGARGNPGLGVAVAVSAVLQLAGVFVPQLRVLLGTESLRPAEVAACVLVASVPGLALGLALGLARRRSRQDPGGSGLLALNTTATARHREG